MRELFAMERERQVRHPFSLHFFQCKLAVTFSLLASGSDDYQVILWDPFNQRQIRSIQTGHTNNIFSVQVRNLIEAFRPLFFSFPVPRCLFLFSSRQRRTII